MMYTMRKIPTEFSMMPELGDIAIIRLIKMGFGYTILIWDFDDMFYTNLIYILLYVFFDFLCLWRSGYKYFRETYSPNDIMPYPITKECISNFDLAIIMPTTVSHFYEFLQRHQEFKEALIMFGLHSDIRVYMAMNDESEYYSNKEIHDQAVHIFEDYIVEDCKWTLRNYPLTQAEKRRKNLETKIAPQP